MRLVNIIIMILLMSTLVYATDCPYGLVNDPAPGECGRYIDKNNDGFCDNSQTISSSSLQETASITSDSNPIAAEENNSTRTNAQADNKTQSAKKELTGQELKAKTVLDVAKYYEIDSKTLESYLEKAYPVDVKQEQTFQFLHDNYGFEHSTVNEIAIAIKDNNSQYLQTLSKGQIPQSLTVKRNDYGLLPMTIAAIILYILTFYLVKIGKLKQITNYRIWNILLLLSFLITGITALAFLLRSGYGIIVQMPFNLVEFHNMFGTAMIIISIVHIAMHYKFFLAMIKQNKQVDK